MKKILIFLFIFFNFGISSAQARRDSHILGYGGIEYIIKEIGDLPSNVSGDYYKIPFIGRTTNFTKLQDGKQVFSVNYTVDLNGYRTGPSAHMKGKTKHLLLIDASIAFGEGLNDNETIHNFINKKSKIYEAYELGLPGEGPQHNWLRFNSKKMPDQISQKSGTVIFITNDADIGKYTGALSMLPFGKDFPKLVEISPGKFINTGTFLESGTFLEKTLLNYCIPYNFCNTWLAKIAPSISEDAIASGAKIFKELDRMYREQFKAEDSMVLWTGSDIGRRYFIKHSDLKVIQIFFHAYEDGHPNKEGAEEIADALFKKGYIK